MSAVTYGVEAGHAGSLNYPWDSCVQFTSKRHYVLTIVFQDDRLGELAAMFELDKSFAGPILDLNSRKTNGHGRGQVGSTTVRGFFSSLR